MKTTERSTFTKRTNHKFMWCMTLILAISLSFTACEGPQGPQGERGPQGEEGPVGPAGEDGSVIHAGEGAPAADVGAIGDFYLDTAAAEMYGPKTQDGWGVPFTLQGSPGADGEDGADGQDGEDGSQIYAGNGAPDASLGVIGDYYLDKANYDLYGPKTDSGWGTPLNLQATTNVMYTSWFEPVWDQVDEARHKRLRITEFKLTSEFKAGGVILVYHRDIPSPGNLIDRLLPNTVYFVDGEVARIYRSEVIGNGIYIEVRAYTQDLDPDDYDGEHNRFRYVLIPGSEDISSKVKNSNFPINLESYQQVRKYFGIKKGRSMQLH